MPYAAESSAIITADLLTDDLVDGATLRESPAEAPELTRSELARIASARTARLSTKPASRSSRRMAILRFLGLVAA